MTEPVLLKPKATVFLNVFRDLNGCRGAAYSTRKLADHFGKGREAVVEVPYTPGEGLDDIRS